MVHDDCLITQLLDRCRTHLWTVTEDGELLYLKIFADAAYGWHDVLISPYVTPSSRRTEIEDLFNSIMSTIRIEVEHAFGLIVTLWPFVNAVYKQRMLLSPVGSYYRVATLLTNAHTCIYGNQTSHKFNLQPPSLEEYFHPPSN
ncbi:hypothetical protein NUW54_g13473 [Trametes sanguinea]|uniref:Uncharacterized protein n=1 Tax=Trametes sanguinea TaxID=158606 RepID=A0ACC1MKK8_9APHY|nr:hypothetical protein NUW54_g13473 [Trametes sanguinea]